MPETAKRHAEGGVWETLIEEAAMRVITYLTSSTQPFDRRAPVAQAMLLLLDRPMLREIVMERNYNKLCGRLGCAQAPRVVFGTASRHTRHASNAQSSSDEESVSEEGENEDQRDEEALAAQHTRNNQRTTTDEETEVVYDDDVFIEEGFRLAARQQRQLARMRRAAQRAREEAMRRTANASEAGQANERNDTVRTQFTLPRFEERFCSPECVDLYLHELRPCVRPCTELNDPHLLPALATLFPNLRPEVLHRLASAETAQSAKGILGNITEKDTRTQPMQPVQETTTDKEQQEEGTAQRSAGDTNNNNGEEAMTRLLRTTLQEMHILQRVWSTEFDSPSFRVQRITTEEEEEIKSAAAHEKEQRVLQECEGGGNTPVRSRGLQGPLLVIDACIDFATPQTRRLFLQRYKANRTAIQAALQKACDMTSSRGKGTPMHVRLVQPIIDELEASFVQEEEEKKNNKESDTQDINSSRKSATSVHPVRQQERRELLASHVFSAESSAALSRLLQFDYHVLTSEAWTRVWLSAHDGTTLLSSLQFPFAIPASLLRPAASTREVLLLATVLLLSTLCVNEAVWHEFARQVDEAAIEDEESGQEPLVELMQAVGVSEDDLRTALRALVLCDS